MQYKKQNLLIKSINKDEKSKNFREKELYYLNKIEKLQKIINKIKSNNPKI